MPKPKIKVKEIKSKIKIIESENDSKEEPTLESEVQESDSTFGTLSPSSRRRFSPLQTEVNNQLEQQREVGEVAVQGREEEKREGSAFSYGVNRGAQTQNAFEAEEKRRRGYESQSVRQTIAQPLDSNMLRRAQAPGFQEDEETQSSVNQRIQTQEPSMFRPQEDETKKYDFDSTQSDAQRRRRRMF